ncbi:MAG: ABC transporter permease [Candidatus Zixiibacteriota bacterium]|nr:MAG: ABC transporter permease [candidate division Zixibacteria bacterium]
MLKNYIKIPFRSMIRNKGYSTINIAGLAVGMAVCILVLLWMQEELSYDRFHANASCLYRVEQDQIVDGRAFHVNLSPQPMAPRLTEEIPGVAAASRFLEIGEQLIRYQDIAFYERGARIVDSSFLAMLSFPLVRGDAGSALRDPYSLVVTESIARKYFGDEDALGKVVSVNGENELTVTGVLKDLPDNTWFSFDMLSTYAYAEAVGAADTSWTANSVMTLIQLGDEVSPRVVGEKVSELVARYTLAAVQADPSRSADLSVATNQFSLMPVTDLELYAHFGFGTSAGQIGTLYSLMIVGVLVLLIGCMNFMNLYTARSIKRAREMGLRKVLGANRAMIVRQFFAETIIFTFIGMVVALILVELVLPAFNGLFRKSLSLDLFSGVDVILGLAAVGLLTGLIAGSYPAILFSSSRPGSVLRAGWSRNDGVPAVRRILVVIQFALSILLIIGTTVIYQQTMYMKTKDVGYSSGDVLIIPARGNTSQYYTSLKTELLRDPRVLGVTGSWQRPTDNSANTATITWDGKDPEQVVLVGVNAVDVGFVEALGIEMVEGRAFSADFATDSSSAFLINEKMADVMGGEGSLGMTIRFPRREGQVIGVMKDFHRKRIQNEIDPLVLTVSRGLINNIIVKLDPTDIRSSLDAVEEVWETVVPGFPFEYSFLDRDFEYMFRSEERAASFLSYGTILAILTACLGLFGLAAFSAEQRTKEIGIRKVLGSSVTGIFRLLTREFLVLVAMANAIAWPVAYYVMNRWLQDFAYRIEMGIGTFVLAGLAAMIIALLTVSFQAVKAARSNPVEALKYE